jgi:hypothetical protein
MDEDENQSNRHFRRLPLESLLSNCLEEAIFPNHGLGKSLVPKFQNPIMFAQDFGSGLSKLG